ncbi:serendipity locus protein alpha-like [Ostrinia furnacalis]|uniref:serendipity locus protein alpha-like n=1 Tax=Ostrinia furnacalis TaxID=93504 RepID=UPI00103883D6|nr:serendipity locus protein alpha-like [Ostrinia furnacalis]
MNADLYNEVSKVSHDTRAATKYVVDFLLDRICPVLQKLRSQLQALNDRDLEEEIVKIRNVFLLTSSQIKKCIVNFFDVLKVEHKHGECLQESRQFIFERLSWCLTKLSAVEKNLDRCERNPEDREDLSEDAMFVTPMYFVNWIDYTFDILSKLAENVYRTDYKNNDLVYNEWKEVMVQNATSLHMCIDELLLSAMTLCKYCLAEDQTILKARCQVVLRETKALFNELTDEDISASIKITPDNLKLPIKPSNVNILIDVLKDVLYVLETNTNTALLALLIHCYVNCSSPVDILKNHFDDKEHNSCPCHSADNSDEKCTIVEDFDLYNERLVQIGSFAVSCSSDQKRILTLRSCLSSLEALDPHLVPAVMTSPNGLHTQLLINIWKQEVMEIRDTVFLIVDPVAFVEKCKQYMHELLLGLQNKDSHDRQEIWIVMNIGTMVYDFFSIYKKYEPDAIAPYEDLDKLLENLNRASKECKTVSNFFTTNGNSFLEAEIKVNQHKVTFESFMTRIKLLYSIVKKINALLHPKDTDEQFFGEEEAPVNKNYTHTIHYGVNTQTYTNCRKPGNNLTRSVFARTSNVQSSTRNMFLSKLTKHLQIKKSLNDELSFSAQVSELFNVQKERKPFPSGNLSLRKAIFTNKCELPFLKKMNNTFDVDDERESQLLDRSASLQISEILNQINDITTTFSSPRKYMWPNTTKDRVDESSAPIHQESFGDISTSNISNETQPSSINTLERISDLDLVESKLNSLRNSEFETHL